MTSYKSACGISWNLSGVKLLNADSYDKSAAKK